jgi:hypothetical protein
MFWIAIILLVSVIGIIAAVSMSSNDSTQTTTQPSEPERTEPKVQYTPEQLILLGEVLRQAKERNDQRTIEQVNSLTYRGHMPVLKQDGSYTSYRYVRMYSIAGINKRRGIKPYLGKFCGYIKPEPSNKFDPNAIAVYHEDGKHLGYIPATETDGVRRLGQDFPMFCWGEIIQVWGDRKFFVGDLYIEEIYADEARLPAYVIKKKPKSVPES